MRCSLIHCANTRVVRFNSFNEPKREKENRINNGWYCCCYCCCCHRWLFYHTSHTHTVCAGVYVRVSVCLANTIRASIIHGLWFFLNKIRFLSMLCFDIGFDSPYLSVPLSLSVYFYLYSKHHLPIRTGVCLLLIFSWHRPSFLIIKSCTKHNDQMSAGGHEHGRKENLLDMEMQGWNPPFFLKKKKKKTFCKMYAKRTESFSHFAAENIVGVFDWPSRVRSIVCVCALWRQQPVPW